jgi:pimeloyl-ACP methyl ester carboxylesterase
MSMEVGHVRGVSASGMVYERRGAGCPVVLVHGWCLNGRLWTSLQAGLLPDHDVIVVDLPGFGRSDGLDGPYDLPRHAAAIAELLAELDVRDARIVGFAFGAAVAMELAAADATRIAGIIGIGVPSGATAAYERMPSAMRRDWPDFARRSAVAICAQPQSDATLDALATMFGSTLLPVALETVGVLARFEPVPLAPRVPVPAWFVHGQQDNVVPVDVSSACAAAAPLGRLEIVPDSGHLVPFDQPKALEALVRRFLGEQASIGIDG